MGAIGLGSSSGESDSRGGSKRFREKEISQKRETMGLGRLLAYLFLAAVREKEGVLKQRTRA